MDKKSIIIGLLVIIILIVVGMFVFGMTQNQIKVGDASFTLPEGYTKGISNQHGHLNITNGYNSIFFAEYNGSDVNKYIVESKDFIISTNKTPLISNFTTNGITVNKMIIVNDTQYYRYWFVDNGKVYCIYTWDGNTNTDSLITSLINSMKTS